MNVAGATAPWRVARRELRGRRRATTLLFVGVVALAAAAIVVGLGSRRSAAAQWDDAFETANGPHVILHGPDPAALTALLDSPDVTATATVQERQARYVHGSDRIGVVVREADPDALPRVGAPDVVAGRLATGPAELELERSFADDLGVGVGDPVELLDAAGTPVTFDVVGLVLDFQDCFWPQCDPGVVWATPAGAARLGGEPDTEVLARLRDPQTAPERTAELLAAGGDQVTGAQDWLDTRADALAVDTFFGAFLAGFGAFVLVAAGVVVAGTVSNRAAARRRDIGLLKAVGFTPRQILAATVLEHLALAAAGLAVGWLLAVLLAPRLVIGVAATLGTPARDLALGPVLVAATVLAVLTVAATVPPTVRAARRTTAAALGAPTGTVRRSRLGRLGARLGGGPTLVTGLKDAFDRPLRAVLAITSVVLAVVALVVTFATDRTFADVTADPASTGDPWDATVAVDGRPADVVATIAATPGVADAFTEWSTRAPVDGQVVLVRTLGGDPAAARFVIQEGRPLRADGEAIAGYGLLQLLGKGVGDTVTVTLGDTVVDVTIVGRYGETEDTGEVLQVREGTLAAAIGDTPPDRYRVSATPSVTPDELAASLRASLGPAASVEPRVTESEDLDAFEVAFWALATLLTVVALANVGATVLLGVRERRRDAGVLRTLGFTPVQLVTSTAIGTAVLAVIAAAVGVPLGLWTADVLMRGVGEAIGFGPELGSSPTAATLAAIVVVVAAATVAVGATAAGRTASRSASELVRYE